MPPVAEPLAQLRALAGEILDLEKAATLLAWDEETYMPPGGAPARAEQRGTLHRLAHERWVSDELTRLLDELATLEEQLDPDSDDASLIRVTRRDTEKARRVPPELQAELTRNASIAYRAWLEAREANDFAILLPHLERSLELRHRYIACFAPYDDPYDVLLDDYEPEMKTTDIDPVFARLKPALVGLVEAVRDAEPIDDSCLRGNFPVDEQRRFSLWLMERWGLDPTSWRLDPTVHPFATSMSTQDIRLTTRLHESHLGGVMACLHEFGHGLYEHQVSTTLDRTPLASGVSSTLHESQSRMWENLVGRNIATWRFAYSTMQEHFPEQLGNVSLETFHRAINKVQPSLIRVEADEVTYSLHIILRYELEREILSGTLALADLPEAFDTKMREYLGLQPPDVLHGVLQDAHWSDLGFGYFPTYALGNVVSVQIWERARADLGDLEAQFEQGDFAGLRDWLGEHLHRYGRKFTPTETIERVAGAPMDPAPYIEYLQRKLTTLFGATVSA